MDPLEEAIGGTEVPRADEEIEALIDRAVERHRSKIHIESRPTDFDLLCKALNWCAWIAGLGLLAGLGSIIVMYGNQRSMQNSIDTLSADVQQIRGIIDHRLPQ